MLHRGVPSPNRKPGSRPILFLVLNLLRKKDTALTATGGAPRRPLVRSQTPQASSIEIPGGWIRFLPRQGWQEVAACLPCWALGPISHLPSPISQQDAFPLNALTQARLHPFQGGRLAPHAPPGQLSPKGRQDNHVPPGTPPASAKAPAAWEGSRLPDPHSTAPGSSKGKHFRPTGSSGWASTSMG